MATNARSTTRTRTNSRSAARSTTARKPSATTTSTAGRTDASQVREGVTKARHGAAAIVRQGAERAIDVPVGAALTVRDRLTDAVEPWTSSDSRDKELKSLRTQVTRELNRFERRGGQARRKARTTVTREVKARRREVEREVKARRREVEKTVKQNRTKVEKAVKENRVKAEGALSKAQERVAELV
jgi:hypothetical protein